MPLDWCCLDGQSSQTWLLTYVLASMYFVYHCEHKQGNTVLERAGGRQDTLVIRRAAVAVHLYSRTQAPAAVDAAACKAFGHG